MAAGIVPGGCDTWEHAFEAEQPPGHRLSYDLTDLTESADRAFGSPAGSPFRVGPISRLFRADERIRRIR
jgi:hypothetical protein